MSDSQADLIQTYLNSVEKDLQSAVGRASVSGNSLLRDMLTYHMGWSAKPISSDSRGKRFRPLLVLLTCNAAGGNWQYSLPAATAVELVHNFSLIHDDIEDRSKFRRGRLTVWKKWGIPQAINAGDAMFTLAHLHLLQLSEYHNNSITLKAIDLLQRACLHLTQGQYLDLSYEKITNVTPDDYWNMVEGKTAALISACTGLGALSAGCDDHVYDLYLSFGRLLGLAFQVQDDFLGIWGDTKVTGKSNQSDLVTRKKTLPVLFALSNSNEFLHYWNKKSNLHEDLDRLIQLLESTGAKEYTSTLAQDLIDQAISKLDEADPNNTEGQILKNVVLKLIQRQV